MSDLSRQHGKRWEQYVRRECSGLREAGLALVRKNWRAPEVPESGTRARIEPSKPDFSGVLRGGRHVVFEAKATLSDTSFSFSNITDHQWDHLDQADAAGAMSFLYLLDGERRKWVVPWWVVLELDDERSSYPFDSYPRHRKRRGETWLDALQRLGQIDQEAA